MAWQPHSNNEAVDDISRGCHMFPRTNQNQRRGTSTDLSVQGEKLVQTTE